MQKGCENGGQTVSTISIFMKNVFRGNDDSRWTVCKKTAFAPPKTDPETTKMCTNSMLENVMQKTSTNPKLTPKGPKIHVHSRKSW